MAPKTLELDIWRSLHALPSNLWKKLVIPTYEWLVFCRFFSHESSIFVLARAPPFVLRTILREGSRSQLLASWIKQAIARHPSQVSCEREKTSWCIASLAARVSMGENNRRLRRHSPKQLIIIPGL
jgi:hypothetical protein